MIFSFVHVDVYVYVLLMLCSIFYRFEFFECLQTHENEIYLSKRSSRKKSLFKIFLLEFFLFNKWWSLLHVLNFVFLYLQFEFIDIRFNLIHTNHITLFPFSIILNMQILERTNKLHNHRCALRSLPEKVCKQAWQHYIHNCKSFFYFCDRIKISEKF